MSEFDAGMWLGIIGGLALFFLWVWGLAPDPPIYGSTWNPPKVIRIISRIVSYMAIAALISFVVYCILILAG